jgi:RNA polymerase sigma-70 factor (ECF subfamily)
MPPTTAPRVGAPRRPSRPAPPDGPPLPRQRPYTSEPGTPGALLAPSGHPAGPDERTDGSDDTDGSDQTVTASAQQASAEPDGHPDETGAWALVKASQNGDMVAFGELFDRYYEVVFRYVLFRMGDRTLAEDITQETFVRALRRISSVSYQGRDIGAWFVTIARNLIFDHVKSSRYRLEQTTNEIIELSPSTSGPEQQVLDGATNDELLRCVKKLNPDQQECIQLRFLQGLSVAETAEIMDRNEGAVKALQHRAVRRLAQLLPEGIR